MHYFPALCLFALLAAPASAAETAWQEIAPGVKLRLISSDTVAPDGKTLLGLEIDMPETTKTYWRVPGDTGLPTVLDFGDDSGVTAHRIAWPYPTRDETEDYLDYVYYGPTVLPIEVTLDGSGRALDVAATLGVCSDICIPAQANFTLPTDGASDNPNGLRIKQALANVPIGWDGTDEPIEAVEVWAADRLLAVRFNPELVDAASLIATTDDGEPLFGAPQKSPEPNLVLIPIRGQTDPEHLLSRPVQLTFMTDMGAFEVMRPVEAPPSD